MLPRPISGLTAVVARLAVFRFCRCGLTGRKTAHQPIEIRPRPDDDNIIPKSLMVIALADVLPAQPVTDIVRLQAHCCLQDPGQVVVYKRG